MDDVVLLERVGDATWPALQRRWHDGWLLRFADGVTGRSNSATPMRPGTLPLAAKVAHVERSYVAKGLDPRFRLTPLADAGLEDLLEDGGYDEVTGADVLTLPLARPLRAPATAAAVAVTAAPSGRWLQALSDFGDDRGRPDVMARILEAIAGPAAFASVVEDGAVAAIGMAACSEEVVAVYNMNTEPSHRRRGLGAAVLAALVGWGRECGASLAMLQVRPDNAAAQALYRAQGFETAYRYTYRRLAGTR